MLGPLLDRAYVLLRRNGGGLPTLVDSDSKVEDKSSDPWFLFLPDFIFEKTHLWKTAFPENANVYAYCLPRAAIQPDPVQTRGFLQRVTDEAVERLGSLENPDKLSIIGISLGNAPAFKIANSFPLETLISVVPGSKLPECIWESIATNRIVRGSGKTLEDYQDALKDFSTIENLQGVSANNIEVYLGAYDLMIPYSRGQELVRAMESRGLDPKVRTYRLSGHVEAIHYFSKDFSRRNL